VAAQFDVGGPTPSPLLVDVDWSILCLLQHFRLRVDWLVVFLAGYAVSWMMDDGMAIGVSFAVLFFAVG